MDIDDDVMVDSEATTGSDDKKEQKAADGVKDRIAGAIADDNGSNEETDESDGEVQDDGADDADDGDGKIADGEVRGLSPDAQAKVNERIHKINVRRKDAEAKLAEAETRISELTARISELTARDNDVMREAMRLGLAPDYISKQEAADLKQYESLRAEKRWLAKHRDGYEGTGSDGREISISASDVADRMFDVDEELSDLAPRMKSFMKDRAAQMLKDMQLGRSIRLKSKNTGGQKTLPSQLPKGGKASKGRMTESVRKVNMGIDGFKERGANKSALQELYESMF